jgi:hypothetical protein
MNIFFITKRAKARKKEKLRDHTPRGDKTLLVSIQLMFTEIRTNLERTDLLIHIKAMFG